MSDMNKTSKIMMIVWAALAIVCFVCAFFCPLIPKIFGLVFGGMNIMVIMTLVITYLQGLYYNKKIEVEDGMQL